MPYKLEHWGDRAIVVNARTGKHFSDSPIPIVRARAQLRVLQAVEAKEKGERK